MLVAKKWNSIVAASEAKEQCRSEEAMQKRRGDAIVGVRLPRLEILCYNLICGAGTAALIRICAGVFSKGPVSVGT